LIDQRQRLTRGPCATRSADAVNIIFRDIGQLEIHDLGQFVNVDSSRRDIGCHQHLQFSALELFERLSACVLAFVAMNRHRLDALFVELFCQPVGSMLGAREYQNLKPLLLAYQVRQQSALMAFGDEYHRLLDGFSRCIAASHFDFFRSVQHALGQSLDLVGERGGIQQALTLLRK
jgi:hypothetical protein